MNAGADDTLKLRQAFSSLSRGALPQEGCPEADRIWSAVRGELAPRETREVVDHTASCPACAEAWRLAVEIGREAAEGTLAKPAATTRGWDWRWAAAAAIALVAAGVLLWQRGREPSGAVFRQAGAGDIRSLVPEGRPLPRESFVLRWTGAPEGSTYDVAVLTQELQAVVEADGLEEPELRVPEQDLRDVPSGAELYWYVDAELPGGAHVTSRTFKVLVR